MTLSTQNEVMKEPGTPDYSRKWVVMTAVGMGIFLSTIDGSIVNIALPTFVKDFNAKFAIVQWIALAYILTMATLILSMGRLGDIIGRKPVYASGMVVFTLSSALCGLSNSVYMLIGFRVLQAIGAAMMAALGIALITEAFPPNERGKAYGAAGSFVSIGIITGPTLGGLLIDAFSWHWIFFVNVPIGLIGIWMVLKYVPNMKTNKGQRFDFLGAITLFIGVLSFLLALTLLQDPVYGLKSPVFLALIFVWILFTIAFFYVESKVQFPMIDLKLFRNITFSINLMTGFITFIGTSGVVLLMPFFLENVLLRAPHQVGLMLSTVPIAAGIVSPFSGAMSDKFGPQRIIILGLIIMASGYAVLTTLSQETTTFEYILKFIPIGLGIGIFQSPNNSSIMGAAPREHLGLVSSLVSITRALGQSSGIALVGAFWTYRVSVYSQTGLAGKLHTIDSTAQVKGLQETMVGITFVIISALLLALYNGYLKKRTVSV